jgi:hypothetical protein
MLDSEDDDLVARLLDLMQDPKRSAPCGPDALELVPEGLADALRVLDQRARDEVDDRSGDGFGHMFGDGPCRGPGHDTLNTRRVRRAGLQWARRLRTASTPRTTSPAATALAISQVAQCLAVGKDRDGLFEVVEVLHADHHRGRRAVLRQRRPTCGVVASAEGSRSGPPPGKGCFEVLV